MIAKGRELGGKLTGRVYVAGNSNGIAKSRPTPTSINPISFLFPSLLISPSPTTRVPEFRHNSSLYLLQHESR